jgi:predicted methyltransferase
MDLIDKIKLNNPDLDVSEIRGLLYILKNVSDLTNTSLIIITGLPKETLKKFKQTVSDLLVETEGEKISLSSEGLRLIEDLKVSWHKWSLVENFHFMEEDIEILNKIKNIKKKYSPVPKREYDQFLATPETTFQKSKILLDKVAIYGKSIAFIGDDDLNSLSLASMSSDYKEIVVFEIDDQITSSVEKCSKDLGFKNITVEKYDARKELDKKYLGRFDIVVFDPPYTKTGVTLFLKRATELLGAVKDFEKKYVFMYYGNSFKSPEKILKIQEIVSRFGFSIEDRIEKFARYTGAESIGNASSLYILKANKFTRAPGMSLENIYTYEKTSEEKFPFVDHMVFKVFNVKKEILLSKKRMMLAFENICKIHKLKIVDKNVTEFKGGGVTLSFILANSNLTAHTWPEFGAVHIDLVTCSPIYSKGLLPKTIGDSFETSTFETFFIE